MLSLDQTYCLLALALALVGGLGLEHLVVFEDIDVAHSIAISTSCQSHCMVVEEQRGHCDSRQLGRFKSGTAPAAVTPASRSRCASQHQGDWSACIRAWESDSAGPKVRRGGGHAPPISFLGSHARQTVAALNVARETSDNTTRTTRA